MDRYTEIRSFVLVADGRKSLFFRNEGDGDFPNLSVERKEVRENPDHVDQATDTAGQAASPVPGASGSGGAGPRWSTGSPPTPS